MALTYIETVRLLMGDLDAGDNNFFSGEQWVHLFETNSYDDSNGDRQLNLVDVAQEALRIMSIYHADARPERSKKTDDRVDALGRWPNDIKALYLVDGQAAPTAIADNALTVHEAAATAARAALQAELDAHEASTHNTDPTARGTANVAQASIDLHELNHPTPDVSGDISAHDTAAPSHGSIRSKAQATETGLEGHIAAHPGAVVAGPPADGTVGRPKLTANLLADVDAHADQVDLDAAKADLANHEGSNHNIDTTARSEALAAQTLIAGHQVASAAHNTEIVARIATHAALPNVHHVPGAGGVTISSTAPGNTPGTPDAGDSGEVSDGGHDHGIEPGGGGGGALTAAAIQALEPGATNSNTEIPSVHDGDLGKISIANIHAYMASSVGLGPRINPGPSLETAGQVSAVNAAGDAYELIGIEGGGGPPVPYPTEDGELLVGQGGQWLAQFRPDQFLHVTELPPAVEGGAEFIYLDHTYALGGRRVDADIRFSRVGTFTGYSDPRLGTPAGTLSLPGPITRILMVADNTGLITRYNLVEFIDQESADRYDEIALGPDGNVPLYPLGEPFQHGHVWQRRFVHTEPIGSRLDTQYKVNLGREVDATFFYNDQSGVLYRNGFYELIEVVAGEWIYDAISSLRRVHTSGIGQPVTPPIRTGETYTDDIGRNYTGLVEVIEIDDSGDGTPNLFVNALYVRRPTGLEEILELGRGAWWWNRELGPSSFNQFILGESVSEIVPVDLVRNKNWHSVWVVIADAVTPASIEHIEAVAIRDHSIFLGGVASHNDALDEASLRVSQSDFDNGLRIFYGLAVGNTNQIPNQNTVGIFELKLYTQATITRTRQGIWVGPDATEQRVAELIEVHRAEPTAHQQPGGGGGGGGETRTVLYEGTTGLVANLTELPGSVLCPQVGDLEVYIEGLGGNRENSVAHMRMPAERLYLATAPAGGAGYNNNGTGREVIAMAMGANRAVIVSAPAATHNIAASAQNNDAAGNHFIRIVHIT